MTDTTVNLGDFQFANFEIPEVIPFGGEQTMVVHRLIGGVRIVDAMGEDPTPLEWSGIFVGSNARDRALALDAMRKAGKPLSLTWDQLSYTVIIRSFHADFQRFYRLPYRITCEVVSDDIAPVSVSADVSPEQLIGDDMGAANNLAASIADPTLTGLMSTLTGTIAAAGPLAYAAPSLLGAIDLPLAAARSQVGSLLSGADGVIAGIGSVGGVIPGVPTSSLVSGLASQIAAVTSQVPLISLDRTLGRVSANIAALTSGSKTVTAAGGDLFRLAATEYGDALGWTAIAAANKLIDPVISDISTLTIPRFSNDTGGVLGG